MKRMVLGCAPPPQPPSILSLMLALNLPLALPLKATVVYMGITKEKFKYKKIA